MLGGNADTAITHAERYLAIGLLKPAYRDFATLRCVAHRIRDQIAKRATQLGIITLQLCGTIQLQF